MNSSKIIENKNVPTTNYNYPIKSRFIQRNPSLSAIKISKTLDSIDLNNVRRSPSISFYSKKRDRQENYAKIQRRPRPRSRKMFPSILLIVTHLLITHYWKKIVPENPTWKKLKKIENIQFQNKFFRETCKFARLKRAERRERRIEEEANERRVRMQIRRKSTVPAFKDWKME